MELNKTAGYNLKLIREEKHIKQEALARQLNLSVQTLSAIENGKRDIKLSQLENCANMLEVTVYDLLNNGKLKSSREEKLQFADAVLKVIEINASSNIHTMDVYELQMQYKNLLQQIENIKIKLEEILER